MNQAMTDQLLKLLTFLLETLQESKEFAIEQAPQYVRELLAWEFWSATVWVVVGLAFWCLAWKATSVVDHGMEIDHDEASDRHWMRFWFHVVATGVAGWIVVANVLTMVQVKVAPRVVLIDKVQELLQKERTK